MDGVLSRGDCAKLRRQNEQLRQERSDFLWKLAWAEEFMRGHLHTSSKAKQLHGEIDDLLGTSEEGRYVRECVNDPRNSRIALEAA